MKNENKRDENIFRLCQGQDPICNNIARRPGNAHVLHQNLKLKKDINVTTFFLSCLLARQDVLLQFCHDGS